MRGRKRISSWGTYGLRHQVPLGVGDQIPVQGAGGGIGCSSAGRNPAGVHGERGEDSEGSRESGSRASVCVVPPGAVGVATDAVHQGEEQFCPAAGVSGTEEAVLGEAPLGAGVLLRLVGHGDGRDDQGVHRTAGHPSARRVYGGRREALAGFKPPQPALAAIVNFQLLVKPSGFKPVVV